MQLTEEQRRDAWAECMREMSRRRIPTRMLKHELRGALDAFDDYVDAHGEIVDGQRGADDNVGTDPGKAAALASAVATGRLTALKATIPSGKSKIANEEVELLLAHVLQARDRAFRLEAQLATE